MPCIVFCRGIEIKEDIRKIATEVGVPLFRTDKTTSSFMADVMADNTIS